MRVELEQIAHRAYDYHQIMLYNSFTVSEHNHDEAFYDELKNQINDIKSRLEVKLKKNGKISKTLLNQLTLHHAGKGELYTITHNDTILKCTEYFHTSEILDLIGLIEEKNNIIKAKPLNGEYLKGLQHVHHSAFGSKGYSAIINCLNYWYNSAGQLLPKRESEFIDLIKQSESNVPVRMYDRAIRRKLRKGLTGEWLIYAEHNGLNYFLCLAKHKEGDEAIYKNKITPALEEFPELNECLKKSDNT